MKHSIHRVRSFEQVGTYVLTIDFEDGLSRKIDFEPILEGELFGALRDPEQFAPIQLDPEFCVRFAHGGISTAIRHDRAGGFWVIALSARVCNGRFYPCGQTHTGPEGSPARNLPLSDL